MGRRAEASDGRIAINRYRCWRTVTTSLSAAVLASWYPCKPRDVCVRVGVSVRVLVCVCECGRAQCECECAYVSVLCECGCMHVSV